MSDLCNTANMNDITDSDIITLLECGISIESLLTTYPSLTKNYIIKLKTKSIKKCEKIKRKKNKKKYGKNNNNNHHKEYKEGELDEFVNRYTTFNKKHIFMNQHKHNKYNKKNDNNINSSPTKPKKKKKFCLIMVIATDDDMRVHAHKIILKAQEIREYETYSIIFEAKQIMSAIHKNILNEIIQRKLEISKDIKLKSYFNKLVVLGHCNYYTIKPQNSYYIERFISHEATSIDERYICGMNMIAMSRFIQYMIQDLAIYNISLCCCESATKNVHLECETLDELDDDEEEIYDIASEYRLMNDISVKPQFVNINDKEDEHLFVAFKYNKEYAELIDNLMTNRHKNEMMNICNHSLSVLDVISYELYKENVLQTLNKPLYINALNGFGHYRYPEISMKEMNDLKDEIMAISYRKQNVMSCIFNLDKEFGAGPLREDCIYYSIKNRDGVQWLIDKDDKKLHKKRNWCQFELTHILDIDQYKSCHDKQLKYDEKYFVHRAHVIQYQFYPLSIRK